MTASDRFVRESFISKIFLSCITTARVDVLMETRAMTREDPLPTYAKRIPRLAAHLSAGKNPLNGFHGARPAVAAPAHPAAVDKKGIVFPFWSGAHRGAPR